VFFGAISTAATLYLIFFIVTFLFRFHEKLFFLTSATLFFLTNVALITDFFIYKLYNFHINAMVLNILTSPDAMDSIQTGYAPVILFIFIVVFFIAIEIFLYKKLPIQNNLLNKPIIALLFFIILTEKIFYGTTNLLGKNEIYSQFRVIPLYQPLTFNKIAYKLFGYKQKKIENTLKKGKLHYPLTPLTLQKTHPNFNILIIASDAAREDFITPEIAPNITNFAKDAMRYTNNYSGGNATRFGIFSLLYGLHSTYWFSFLENKKGAVLFDVLQQLNYNINIYSATNTNWPEFKQTCYVSIQKDIHDSFEGLPWEKDTKVTTSVLNFLETYDKKEPFFSFVFFDSPHGFSYPEKFNTFHAQNKSINYLKASKDSKELLNIKASYSNAIAYDDRLFQKIIAKLKEKNLYDNTLILFTSDHGQEFYEYGYFSHNSAFDKAQLNTPLIIKLPKNLKVEVPNNYASLLTSHNDIVPSILTLLGVQNHPNDYSNGKTLFSKNYKREYVFSANWNNNAIITPQYTYIFSNMPNKIFSNEIRDTQTYKKIKDGKVNTKLLLKIINENTKFLQ